MTFTNTQKLPTSQLLLLGLINIFNYLDRYVINAVLPLIAIEFALSHTQQGQLASAFVIGYTLFSPIFGVLGDRFSRPLLMLIGIMLWSLATILSGIASSMMFLFGARILVGVGEASFGVIAPGYIKDFESDAVKLNKKLALFYIAIPVGSALGYVLGGLIAEHYSWRAAFYLAALPPALLSLFLLRYPELKNRAIPDKFSLSQIKQIFSVKILKFAQLGYIFNTLALTSIAAFIPSYGVSLGFSLDKINSLFGMILVATGIGGTILGAKFSSIMADKSAHAVNGLLKFCGIGSLLAAPLLATSFLVSDKYLFLCLAGLAELLIFASLAPINTVLVLSAPKKLVTLTQGITILMINLFGAFVGPQLVGAIADRINLSSGLQITTIAMIVCSIFWMYGSSLSPSDTTNET